MVGWRWKPAVALVVVAVFLLVQVGVPVTRMLDETTGMSRFGWQMFSQAAEATVFTVITPDGEQRVGSREVLARARGDLPLTELVPPYLCDTVRDAVLVRWEGGEHQC